MTTEGIEAVFMETHNWGKSAKFFQALGYKPDFATDHNSGRLSNEIGPDLFIAEVPADQELGLQLVLRVPDADAFSADAIVDVVTPFEDTHFGTRIMTVRDPDGRQWSLQAPAKDSPSGAGADGDGHHGDGRHGHGHGGE
jgi:hypothetical protein